MDKSGYICVSVGGINFANITTNTSGTAPDGVYSALVEAAALEKAVILTEFQYGATNTTTPAHAILVVSNNSVQMYTAAGAYTITNSGVVRKIPMAN